MFLVTGGTGFLGRHLVSRFLKEGLQVRVIGTGRDQKISNDKGAEYIEADLKDLTSLNGVCCGVDVVFHVAGEKRKKENFYPLNVNGTANILNEAVASKVRRFVYMSSVGVIGKVKKRLVDEETPCHPANEYEKSKWEGEKLALKYNSLYNLPVTVLRPTNVFGENNNELGLLNLIKSVKSDRLFFVGNGDAVVNYIYAGQVATVCLIVARAMRKFYQVFHVACPLSLREFAGLIAEGLNKEFCEKYLPISLVYAAGICSEFVNKVCPGNPVPLNLTKVKALCNHQVYSGERVENEFGINLKDGLKEGLLKTIRYYQKKGLV